MNYHKSWAEINRPKTDNHILTDDQIIKQLQNNKDNISHNIPEPDLREVVFVDGIGIVRKNK